MVIMTQMVMMAMAMVLVDEIKVRNVESMVLRWSSSSSSRMR